MRTAMVLGAYLLVTVLGGWAGDALAPSAVLAIRVGMLLVTLLLLASAHVMLDLLVAARDAITGVGLLIAVTGVGTLAAEGRLGGGDVLPLSPNQLSMMFGFALIVHVWAIIERRATPVDKSLTVLLVALVWLTGSRTGLVALLVAVALVALTYSRRPSGLFVLGTVIPPAIFYILTSTGMAQAYFSRGGGQSVMTLNSRTIAWQAAFAQPYEFWQTWFGRGMSAKTVGVSGTFWDTQVLDSSWVSAFVQGGVLGFLLLALWVSSTLVGTSRMPHPERSLYLAITVFALMWSVTASGLIDSYVLFLLMLVASLSVDRRPLSGSVTETPAHRVHDTNRG
ncbi:MAG: hypothetical protein H0X12_03250 [Nocardioides sp.]|nr:hypothetical protein [Nocardioides sp.]